MRSSAPRRRAGMVLASAALFLVLGLGARAPRAQEPKPSLPAQAKPQVRPHGQEIAVDPATVTVDDGDTVVIKWPDGDEETVRILGIDTPETRHDAHGIPIDQPFGPEARAFARGAFAAASDVRLLRSATLDPYGRTLGYVYLNGKNYSVLAIRARLSDETVGHYGDNGLPAPAAEVTAAARNLPPLRFEPPHVFRKRMRAVSDWERTGHAEP